MVTLIIILITAGVSILCFTGTLNIHSWVFNAYQVWHRKQWHRMLSYGLVHSGWGHLIFNMLRRRVRCNGGSHPLRRPVCQRHRRLHGG